MHGWEKRDAVLICQGASRVQVRRGAAGPREKKDETHPYENERECQRTLGGVRERESWIGDYMIVTRDLWFKR